MIDMCASMNATDISPNRLTRAKQAAIDFVNQSSTLEIGIIV